MWPLAQRVCPYSSISAAPAIVKENFSPQPSSPSPMSSPPPPAFSWTSPKALRSCSFADIATNPASSPPPASSALPPKTCSASSAFSVFSRYSKDLCVKFFEEFAGESSMNTPLHDSAASPSSNPELGELLARVREGFALDRASGLLLAERAPLPELLGIAAEIRARGKGTVVTFSKKVFIPMTTLCRDYCSYCTFRKDPGQPGAHFMTPGEVLALADRGRRAGCKEALFSLGDQPERIFPEAREFLHKQGFARTLDYLAAMSRLVLEKTGLLPHANPGVMDRRALERLKDSNASIGLMLENVSPRLMREGLPHANAPDKVPALRLRTIEEAGKLSIAFTTGILIGIGETMEERIDSLLAIRTLHEKYGHIQEVIIQNFRAKPDIPMAAYA